MAQAATSEPEASPSQQSGRRERPPLDRLLASLAANARHNAHELIAGTADERGWDDLDRAVTRFLECDLVIASQRMEAVALEAERLLQRFDPTGERREGYATTVVDLERHAENGLATLPVQLVAQRLHETLLWYTVWHLFAADYATPDILRVLASRPGQSPRRTFEVPRIPWGEVVATGRTWLAATGVAARAFAGQFAQDRKNPLPTFLFERAERLPNPPQAEPPRTPEPDRRDLPLDGARLRTSIVGTWLRLVALSWVSLVWSAMITMPIGIGALMVAMLGLSAFLLPVWATVWGFLGMAAARKGTLSDMGFQPASPDNPLRALTADYAARLGLPTPDVGTVDAFNAFAMGVNEKDATVAIGQPLVDRLTPEELAAVVGHELGHIVSGDMRRMMLMRTFQNATVWFAASQGLKLWLRWVMCWAAELAILAFSRKREYWADAIGAALAGKDAMIGALRKLEAGPPLTTAENTHARFMVRGRTSSFSTHPSTDDRIRALEDETYLRRLPRREGST